MSDQTEFVLRQELRTLQTMNDSKNKELTTQRNYTERLQEQNADMAKFIDKLANMTVLDEVHGEGCEICNIKREAAELMALVRGEQ